LKEIPVKKIVLSALAVATAAGMANAQPDTNTFGLNLALQPRGTSTPIPSTGGWSGQVADVNGPISIGPGGRVRFEIRYQITDSNNADDLYISTGLIASSLNVTTGLSDAFGTFLRPGGPGNDFGARLTNNMRNGVAQDGIPGAWPIDSSNASAIPTAYGIHQPYRTAVFPDSNGTAVPGQLAISNILPISPAAPGHSSLNDAGDGQNPTWWAIYSFEYTAPAVVVSQFQVPITLTATGSATQFNIFDANTSTDILADFGQRTFSTTTTITVTPAPQAQLAAVSALTITCDAATTFAASNLGYTNNGLGGCLIQGEAMGTLTHQTT
jgi:hypothetical protein